MALANYLDGLLKQTAVSNSYSLFWFSRFGMSQRMCISNKSPGFTDSAEKGTTQLTSLWATNAEWSLQALEQWQLLSLCAATTVSVCLEPVLRN